METITLGKKYEYDGEVYHVQDYQVEYRGKFFKLNVLLLHESGESFLISRYYDLKFPE